MARGRAPAAHARLARAPRGRRFPAPHDEVAAPVRAPRRRARRCERGPCAAPGLHVNLGHWTVAAAATARQRIAVQGVHAIERVPAAGVEPSAAAAAAGAIGPREAGAHPAADVRRRRRRRQRRVEVAAAAGTLLGRCRRRGRVAGAVAVPAPPQLLLLLLLLLRLRTGRQPRGHAACGAATGACAAATASRPHARPAGGKRVEELVKHDVVVVLRRVPPQAVVFFQERDKLGRWAVVREQRRLHALVRKHGLEQLPSDALSLQALVHIEVEHAQRHGLNERVVGLA
eukprot:352908-Chlamydomonas_euryale.AAC.11